MTEKQKDLFGNDKVHYHRYKIVSNFPFKKICKDCKFVSFIKYEKQTICT